MKNDKEICHCPCHTSKTHIVHVIACCYPCKSCGKNIKDEFYNEHVKKCGKEK